MECVVKAYSAFCSLEKFTINGIHADECDFVDKYDHDEENAEEYCCGDMGADIIDSTSEVLDKYKITKDEYLDIAEKVKDEVSFGCCGLCE